MPFRIITVGGTTVRIYSRSSGERFDLVYRLNGRRRMESRGSEAAAVARARDVARLLDRGRANALTLRDADAAVYVEARRLLEGVGAELGVAAAEYAEARRRLGLRGTVLEAVEWFLRLSRFRGQ